MSTAKPPALTEAEYIKWERAYLRSLPPEHFMESTGQSTQREITLESLALLKARRPGVQVFNELLVQYPIAGRRRPGQVVPDNMVVLTDQLPRTKGSYNLPFEPEKPFWVLEYVSKTNERKDYQDNFRRYERDLRVPYYLLFHPEKQDLKLYYHDGKECTLVEANEHGRYAVPELELEVALLGGWVRFWYRGELLPLPGELQQELDKVKLQAEEAARRAEQESRRGDELQRRLEEAERQLAQLRALSPPTTQRGSNPQ